MAKKPQTPREDTPGTILTVQTVVMPEKSLPTFWQELASAPIGKEKWRVGIALNCSALYLFPGKGQRIHVIPLMQMINQWMTAVRDSLKPKKGKKAIPLGPVGRTGRGFELLAFHDHYDTPCTLQQSSLAEYEQPGSSAIWLGVDTGKQDERRMHLDKPRVEALVQHLQHWLDTGYLDLDRQAKEGEK